MVMEAFKNLRIGQRFKTRHDENEFVKLDVYMAENCHGERKFLPALFYVFIREEEQQQEQEPQPAEQMQTEETAPQEQPVLLSVDPVKELVKEEVQQLAEIVKDQPITVRTIAKSANRGFLDTPLFAPNNQISLF